MGYKVELSEESEIDLDRIFDHLVDAHTGFGEPLESAFQQAAERIRRIRQDIFDIGRNPFQGTFSPDVAHGLRHVTKSRAIIYFDVDEIGLAVRVIAVFFGGQDHQRHMLKRGR